MLGELAHSGDIWNDTEKRVSHWASTAGWVLEAAATGPIQGNCEGGKGVARVCKHATEPVRRERKARRYNDKDFAWREGCSNAELRVFRLGCRS